MISARSKQTALPQGQHAGEGLASAMGLFRAIQGAHLRKLPNGRYNFAGRVDARLDIMMPDGSDVPASIIKEIQAAGMPALVKKRYGVRARIWDTPEAALVYADSRGLLDQVANVDEFRKPSLPAAGPKAAPRKPSRAAYPGA